MNLVFKNIFDMNSVDSVLADARNGKVHPVKAFLNSIDLQQTESEVIESLEDTIMRVAIENNHLNIVQELILRGYDCNRVIHDGDSPLLLSIRLQRKLAMIRRLNANSLDSARFKVGERDNNAYVLSIKHGSDEILSELLSTEVQGSIFSLRNVASGYKFDPEEQLSQLDAGVSFTWFEDTDMRPVVIFEMSKTLSIPVEWAVETENYSALKLLSQAGLSLYSGLKNAIISNNTSMIEFLLGLIETSSAPDQDWKTSTELKLDPQLAFSATALNGNIELYKLLTEKFGELNISGYALRYMVSLAASKGHTEYVLQFTDEPLLLEIALGNAAYNGQKSLVKKLLNRYPNENFLYEVALKQAIANDQNDIVDIILKRDAEELYIDEAVPNEYSPVIPIKMLTMGYMSRNYDTDLYVTYKQIPLITVAVLYSSYESAKKLMQFKKGNFDFDYDYEVCALSLAVAKEDLRMISILISNTDELNRAALYACLHRKQDLAQMLFDKGAKATAKLFNGNTALHFAIRDENFILAALVIIHGGDLHAKNIDKLSPLDVLPRTEQNEGELRKLKILAADRKKLKPSYVSSTMSTLFTTWKQSLAKVSDTSRENRDDSDLREHLLTDTSNINSMSTFTF